MTKRRENHPCDRCKNIGSCWYTQIQKGEKCQWLCADCVRIRNAVRKGQVNARVALAAFQSTDTCDLCSDPLLHGKYLDVMTGRQLRGVICKKCYKVLSNGIGLDATPRQLATYFSRPPYTDTNTDNAHNAHSADARRVEEVSEVTEVG